MRVWTSPRPGGTWNPRQGAALRERRSHVTHTGTHTGTHTLEHPRRAEAAQDRRPGAGRRLGPGPRPAAPAEAAPKPTARVVVSGLNNPRQVWRDSHRQALRGRGRLRRNHLRGRRRGGPCLGTTGSIARIHYPGTTINGTFERVVTGLISASGPDGSFAVGADGVSTKGQNIYMQDDLRAAGRDPGAAAVEPGRQAPGGQAVPGAARPSPTSPAWSSTPRTPMGYIIPETGEPELDSNPYAVLALDGRQLVADAAGNTIIEVKHRPGAQGLRRAPAARRRGQPPGHARRRWPTGPTGRSWWASSPTRRRARAG